MPSSSAQLLLEFIQQAKAGHSKIGGSVQFVDVNFVVRHTRVSCYTQLCIAHKPCHDNVL